MTCIGDNWEHCGGNELISTVTMDSSVISFKITSSIHHVHHKLGDYSGCGDVYCYRDHNRVYSLHPLPYRPCLPDIIISSNITLIISRIVLFVIKCRIYDIFLRYVCIRAERRRKFWFLDVTIRDWSIPGISRCQGTSRYNIYIQLCSVGSDLPAPSHPPLLTRSPILPIST